MRNCLVKGILALACLTFISIPASIPASAQSGSKAPSGSAPSGCTNILAPTLSTYTASPGTNVGVFSRITNCTSQKKAYTVVISSTSSCGAETVIASNRISFKGGETKLLSVSYPIAPGTCAGDMAVSVSVYDGGAMMEKESSMLNIQ